MPNTDTEPCLLLCKGKDCKKKQRKSYDRLAAQLDAAGLAAAPVSCQGSCVGPTLVLRDRSGYRWFEDLRSEKAQREIVEVAAQLAAGEDPTVSKRLRKRELTGKHRKQAAKRLQKALS